MNAQTNIAAAVCPVVIGQALYTAANGLSWVAAIEPDAAGGHLLVGGPSPMARIHWRIVAVSSDGRRSTMDEHTAARSPEAVRDWFGQASSACPPFPAARRVGSRAVVSLPGHSGKTVDRKSVE